jgi:hypothetical protein
MESKKEVSMPVEQWPFDCSKPLRAWIDDPTKSVPDRMLSMIKCYWEAYRRMVIEIRRLETENLDLRSLPKSTPQDDDLTELQRVIDASIAILDPDGE